MSSGAWTKPPCLGWCQVARDCQRRRQGRVRRGPIGLLAAPLYHAGVGEIPEVLSQANQDGGVLWDEAESRGDFHIRVESPVFGVRTGWTGHHRLSGSRKRSRMMPVMLLQDPEQQGLGGGAREHRGSLPFAGGEITG